MPQTFGRYELGELLGRGGMGEVYRAYDTVRERDVALKVLPQNLAEDEWFTSRFRRESRLAAQLNEPHIIPIHDFGEIDGRLFIDMRLVEGQDLGTALRDVGRLSPGAAVDVIGQVASALDAAHQHDLVHRDVKPSNVLLTGRTDDPYRPPFAYLVDFGIARSNTQQMTALTTTSSSTIGTVAYMAPERIAGRPGDKRVDVYALACVLYEVLTGAKPFAGEVFAVMFAHVNTPAPRASAVSPSVPPALDEVIARGMAKSENERFASAGELAAAARRALREAGAPAVQTPAPPLPTGPQGPTAPPAWGPTPSGPVPVPPHPSGPVPSGPIPAWPVPSGPLSSGPIPSGPTSSGPTSSGPTSGVPPSGPVPVDPRQWQPPPPPPGARPVAIGAPLPPDPPVQSVARAAAHSAAHSRRPTRSRKRMWIAAAAVVVVAAAAIVTTVLVGGSDGNNRPEANPTGPLASVPRAAVHNGGPITWAISNRVANFNPLQIDGFKDTVTTVTGALLPTPFELDANAKPTVDHDYFTSVTETQVKDSANVTTQSVKYDINPKAKWSDGKPITWADIAAQWKALNAQNPNYQPGDTRGYGVIGSVTKGRNKREAIVKFDDIYTDWRALFSPLLPASLTSTSTAFDNAWVQKPLVTAGPFRWGSTGSGGTSYTIRRNPQWWGDKAKLSAITFKVYADPAAAARDVVAHKLDYADLTQNDEQANVRAAKGHDGVSVRTGAGGIYRQFTLNTKDPLLSDEAVRQAVILGIDRARIAATMLKGVSADPTTLDNHVFAQNQTGYKATCGSLCKYDASRARLLLERAGWKLEDSFYSKNGHELRLTMTIPSNTPNSAREASLAKSQLLAAGINLEIKVVPQAKFFGDYINPGKFQLTTLTLEHGPFPINFNLLYPFYVDGDPDTSFGSGGSDEINEVLDAAAGNPRRASAITGANQGSNLMWQDAAWVPLYSKPQVTAVSSGLVNIGPFGFATPDWSDIGFRS